MCTREFDDELKNYLLAITCDVDLVKNDAEVTVMHCRNQRLFTISFILHATDTEVNMCCLCIVRYL